MTVQSDLDTALSLLQAGRHKAAYKAAKKAMGKHKAHPVFPNVAGIALCATGSHRDGIPYFRKALNLDPSFHDARKNLAQTLVLLGQGDSAAAQLDRLARDTPDDPAVWYLLAQLHLNAGRLAEGLAAADRAVTLAPRQARNYNLRALLRDRLGQSQAALADYEAALALNPDDVETLVNVSLPLARQLRGDEAMAAVRRAVALAPAHLGARLRLAAQLVETGDSAAAQETYRAALEIAPGQPEALEQLALLQDRAANAALKPAVLAALKTAKGEGRAGLSFALARMAEQEGDAQGFARRLSEANAEMAKVMPFDPVADAALADAILARFPDPLPDAEAAAIPPSPVYVLGLPRSGTTLAEAILGAHPQVCALGERAAAGILLFPLIESGGRFDPAAFREQDRAMLPPVPVGTTHYTDKMPENYRLIGFLKTAYPAARIVNLRRDPRDIALSMWRGHFSGRALAYTYDLAAMAARFNGYARMMAHWRRVFPGQILDLSYEEMVADVEAASRTLAEWCGLDWQPAMARPDLSAEQVLTLSASQLRQPVHSRSVGRWREHASMLEPFVAGLDPALWPEIA